MKLTLTCIFSMLLTVCQAQLDSLRAEYEKMPDDSTKADLAIEISKLYGNLDSARSYLEFVDDYSDRNNWYKGKGRVHEIIALVHYRQGKMDSAISRWKRAIEWHEKSTGKGAKMDLAKMYYNIGISYYLSGNYLQALDNNKKALDLNIDLADTSEILDCYNIISLILMEQDEHEAAKPYLDQALFIASNAGDTAQVAVLYNNLAIVKLEKEEYDSCIYYFEESLNYYKNEFEKVGVRMNLGVAYMKKGDLEKARTLLIEGVDKFAESSDVRSKITSLNLLGDLYVETEEWMELKRVSDASLKLLEDAPILNQKRYALKNLSLAYEKLGDSKKALELYKEFTTVKDSLFSESKLEEIKKMEAQFENEKSRREISELTQENLEKEVKIQQERNIRILAILISGVGVFVLVIVFINFKRKKEKKQLTLEKKRLEIEQRMLRSQMNPHFIFNALNSIQSYITTNRGYEAEVFLSKFSLLIRKILENSTHALIELEEELATLNLYLELEKGRFQDKFDFDIENNAEEDELIPPMLLQPFVENAIIHGMKEKEGKGLIKVRIDEDDDYLICEVEDNGVGRKVKGDSTHTSLSTKLINERIQFLQEEKYKEVDLVFEDLVSEDGESMGTRVILKLPLKND